VIRRTRALTTGRAPEDLLGGDRTTRLARPDGCPWMFSWKKGDFDRSKAPKH
jgi:hypothetical protein